LLVINLNKKLIIRLRFQQLFYPCAFSEANTDNLNLCSQKSLIGVSQAEREPRVSMLDESSYLAVCC